jgi:hypothetical protein
VNLEQWDKTFEEAPIEPRNENLPDGHYQVRVDRVELVRTKSGKDALKWQFVVVNGDYAERKTWKYSMMESTDNIKFLKNDLFTVGLQDLQKLSDLPGRLDDLLDVIIEITLKTKNDMQNTYLNKRIETTDPQATGMPF